MSDAVWRVALPVVGQQDHSDGSQWRTTWAGRPSLNQPHSQPLVYTHTHILTHRITRPLENYTSSYISPNRVKLMPSVLPHQEQWYTPPQENICIYSLIHMSVSSCREPSFKARDILKFLEHYSEGKKGNCVCTFLVYWATGVFGVCMCVSACAICGWGGCFENSHPLKPLSPAWV